MEIVSSIMLCPKCDTYIWDNANFCQRCGYQLIKFAGNSQRLTEHSQKMKPENAGILLQSTQIDRIHNVEQETLYMSAITAMIALIWVYFLVEYVKTSYKPEFILIPAAISAFLLGIWRYQTIRIDKGVAILYPDLFFLESQLDIPDNFEVGTKKFLVEEVAGLDKFFSKEKSFETQYRTVNYLCSNQLCGSRGHYQQNLFAMSLILFFTVLGFYYYVISPILQNKDIIKDMRNGGELTLIYLIFITLGICVMWYANKECPRSPTKEEWEKICNSPPNS